MERQLGEIEWICQQSKKAPKARAPIWSWGQIQEARRRIWRKCGAIWELRPGPVIFSPLFWPAELWHMSRTGFQGLGYADLISACRGVDPGPEFSPTLTTHISNLRILHGFNLSFNSCGVACHIGRFSLRPFSWNPNHDTDTDTDFTDTDMLTSFLGSPVNQVRK